MPGSSSVVVSQGFWKNRLGADPAIVGRTIWLGSRAYTIVGIADRKQTAPSMYGKAFAGAVVVLVVAASTAVLVPARRASQMNPAQLLKLG